MSFITAGCGKSLSDEGVEVYFHILREVPYDVMLSAVKNVLRLHVWATFPSVAEIWQAAVNVMRPAAISSGEAWQLAWEAAGKIDPELNGQPWVHVRGGERIEYASQFAMATEGLPPVVVQAMKRFGVDALTIADVKFARSQFIRIYEQLQEEEDQRLLLPRRMRGRLRQLSKARCR